VNAVQSVQETGLPPGQQFWTRSQLVVIAVTIVLAALFFAFTRYLTNSYQQREKALAVEWFQRGQQELQNGRPEQAVSDFRNALLYSQNNSLYRLRLAEALAAGNHLSEARAYLLSLWEEAPGEGLINLELARLAAREHNLHDVQRFYQGAIYGAWQDDPTEHRRQARMELIQYLLQQGLREQAQSEVIALAASLPADDPTAMLQTADLFMKTGDFEKALGMYQKALTLQPGLAEAMSGAGEAALALSRYQTAYHYLKQAAEHGHDPQIEQKLQATERVLEADPFKSGLSSEEKARRAVEAFEQAGKRLESCNAAQTGSLNSNVYSASELLSASNQWRKLYPRVTRAHLARDPAMIESVMQLVFQIELQAQQICGSPQDADLALLAIARHREAVEQ